MTRALLIMGPTASGKSALALAVAEKHDGEIVNADSMQAYRDLRVLSARPSADEEARARHHLYGHVDASVRHSAGMWLDDVTKTVAEIAARGRLPIIVGGTGLYFKVLTEGLSPAPAGSPAVRAALQALLDAEGPAGLHNRLTARDPDAAARIRPSDPARLIRALEVLDSGGATAALLEKEPPRLTHWAGLALTPPREALYAAINTRFDAMMAEGALEEVKALLARRLDWSLPAMKAHGMPPLSAYLDGKISPAAAVE
ncbi:MAG: tRNA (adenosine(37)-N6)-dimethylallyltransferase MiaA, partial [Caulobacterales bacterium]